MRDETTGALLAVPPEVRCGACQGRGYNRPFLGTGNPEQRPCRRCESTGREPAGHRVPGTPRVV
jgi:hypothetical protein